MRPSQGLGAGRGPRGKGGKGDVGPRGRAGRGAGAGGEGQGAKRGTGSGAPSQPDVKAVQCIPTGIQHMPAHHAHHHHQSLYNTHPDMGDLIPSQPPRPPYQPAPHPPSGAPRGPAPAAREPRAEPARTAAAPAARESGAVPAQQAQEPQAEPARGAEGARGDWARDWDAIPDPLGGEALPLVMEVYGWLSWATSGTTRGLTNRPFDAVLLQRDRGNQEVPQGGSVAQEDHERVLRAVIRASWSDREPTWPAFLETGAVLRVTDAEANNWLPWALRTAPTH